MGVNEILAFFISITPRTHERKVLRIFPQKGSYTQYIITLNYIGASSEGIRFTEPPDRKLALAQFKNTSNLKLISTKLIYSAILHVDTLTLLYRQGKLNFYT